jgi:hypothetical protein
MEIVEGGDNALPTAGRSVMRWRRNALWLRLTEEKYTA